MYLTERADERAAKLQRGGTRALDLMEAPDLMDGRCRARSKQTGDRCKRRPTPGGGLSVTERANEKKARLDLWSTRPMKADEKKGSSRPMNEPTHE